MKSGNDDNSLMFSTLADLPSKPRPFPRVECAGITLWSKDEYRDWQKIESKKAGVTDGNSTTLDKKGQRRHKQSSEESAHPYLQNKDGTLVADLSDMSSKICSVWESLERHRMAPQTFGKISSEAWEFITHVVLPLPEFEFLLFAQTVNGNSRNGARSTTLLGLVCHDSTILFSLLCLPFSFSFTLL